MLRVPPLPSTRLWWGFVEQPEMRITVEPFAGDTNVGFQMIKEVFEKRINNGIRDALVYPNMEDLTIFGCNATAPIHWGVDSGAKQHPRSQ